MATQIVLLDGATFAGAVLFLGAALAPTLWWAAGIVAGVVFATLQVLPFIRAPRDSDASRYRLRTGFSAKSRMFLRTPQKYVSHRFHSVRIPALGGTHWYPPTSSVQSIAFMT